MWVIKWRTSCRIESDAVIGSIKEMEDVDPSEMEMHAIQEKMKLKAQKHGLPDEGLVEFVSGRREYAIDTATFYRVPMMVARVDYVLGVFNDKLEFNKFKLTNPDIMKKCRVIED